MIMSKLIIKQQRFFVECIISENVRDIVIIIRSINNIPLKTTIFFFKSFCCNLFYKKEMNLCECIYLLNIILTL